MAGCYSRAMQRLFARRPPAPARLDVRPATLADRGALARLTEHSRRTHFHLDWWSIDDWLAEASSNAWVAVAGNPIAGAVIVPANELPVAWVRLVAIADGYDARAMLDALFAAALPPLHAVGAGPPPPPPSSPTTASPLIRSGGTRSTRSRASWGTRRISSSPSWMAAPSVTSSATCTWGAGISSAWPCTPIIRGAASARACWPRS